MKRILFFLIFISTIVVNKSTAQNTAFKQGLSFKTLFLDYQSQNGGDISAFKDYRSGFEIAYHRHLNDKIKLVIPLHMGVVNSHDTIDNLRKNVYGADAQFNYQFIKKGSSMVPYLIGGVGIVGEQDGKMNVQIPIGVGVNFRIAPNAYINWQSNYRVSFLDGRNNLQHGLGFTYLFGKSNLGQDSLIDMGVVEEVELTEFDSDGDGVSDELDLCPQEPGLVALKGCPDTDGDGISDFEDECPEFAGLKSLQGCPDSDGDGVSDNDDECPNIKGTVGNNGCPDKNADTDGDGIPNHIDKCPNVAGVADNSGCPKMPDVVDSDGDGVADKDDKCPTSPGLSLFDGCPDTDGDGLHDGRDKCPTVAGPVSNSGCPELKKEDKKTLEVAMRAVQFRSGKSTIKRSSYKILNQIKSIMDKYPSYNLSIAGHTDNTGRASINQNLSERRAKACHDYLVQKGVNSNRMSHTGFGETRPIADNNTLSGKTLNRREEYNLTPE